MLSLPSLSCALSCDTGRPTWSKLPCALYFLPVYGPLLPKLRRHTSTPPSHFVASCLAFSHYTLPGGIGSSAGHSFCVQGIHATHMFYESSSKNPSPWPPADTSPTPSKQWKASQRQDIAKLPSGVTAKRTHVQRTTVYPWVLSLPHTARMCVHVRVCFNTETWGCSGGEKSLVCMVQSISSNILNDN